MGAKGLGALVAAFRINWGMSLGIEELNISGNPLDAETGRYFTEWLKEMAEWSSLRRLSVANTGMPLGVLFLRLKVCLYCRDAASPPHCYRATSSSTLM